jgi:hypothetical protein
LPSGCKLGATVMTENGTISDAIEKEVLPVLGASSRWTSMFACQVVCAFCKSGSSYQATATLSQNKATV